MKTELALATMIVLALTVSLFVAAYRRTSSLILRGYLRGWRYDALRSARSARLAEDDAWQGRAQAAAEAELLALVRAMPAETRTR